MAEVLVAPETEQTPPEDVANPTPEVATEGAPEGENQEGASFIDDILKGIDSESASTADDGKGASPDGSVPSAELQPRSEEDIRADERRKVADESGKEKSSTEYLNRVNSLNFVAREDVPAKLTALAEKYNMQATDVTELFTQVNRLHGALKPVLEYELEQQKPQIVNQAGTEMQKQVASLIFDALKEDLGEPALKAVQDVKSWADLTKAITKEARKGFVPAADYTSKASVKTLLTKIDTAAKEHGLSLAAITGNGGSDVTPARGGSGNNRSDDAKLLDPNTPITEVEAIRARQRRAGG